MVVLFRLHHPLVCASFFTFFITIKKNPMCSMRSNCEIEPTEMHSESSRTRCRYPTSHMHRVSALIYFFFFNDDYAYCSRERGSISSRRTLFSLRYRKPIEDGGANPDTRRLQSCIWLPKRKREQNSERVFSHTTSLFVPFVCSLYSCAQRIVELSTYDLYIQLRTTPGV